jgi:hypothetical protein
MMQHIIAGQDLIRSIANSAIQDMPSLNYYYYHWVSLFQESNKY